MTTTSLPPYTGPGVTCIKCSGTGASTTYLGYGECVHGRFHGVLGYEPNQRLHRECDRCGHQWDEATTDEKQAADDH